MNEQEIAKLAQAFIGALAGKTQKAVSSSPGYTYGYNAGGLFATPGLERPLFSAMLMPNFGLQSRLPVKPSNYTNPTYGIITGVGASTGSNPNGVCDDPKTVGLATMCTQTAFFGRWSLQTAVIDIDQIGKRVNRAVMTDLQIMNTPVGNDGGLMPTAPGGNTALDGAIKSEVNKILFEFGVAWARDYGKQLYTGNPSNNTAGGGYKEFLGVNALVNTGRLDAVTGTLCPAADSIVFDFTSLNISGSANAANASALLVRIVAIYRNLKYIASRTGLNPVKWALVMPDQLFYEVTAMWPCNYLTNQCQTAVGTTAANVNIQVNGTDAVKMRDEMRSGSYLWVDGQQLEVIIDEAIVPVTADGGATYTAPMYFIPLTVLGNTDVTYLEYFDYGQPGGSLDAARVFAPDGTYSISDNGRFLWHKKPPTNFCVQLLAKTETRLIMLTPYLAARIINIKYAPTMVTRSPYPGDLNYVAGGTTTQPTNWIPATAP